MRYKIFFVFLLAIIVRIPFLFLSGYPDDMQYFTTWSSALGEHGIRSFYVLFRGDQLSFPSYALYAPMLWGIGSGGLLKIPILFFDIVSGVLLYFFLKGQEKGKSIVITAAYLFNPALLYAGIVWGQVDTIVTFFVFFALILVVYKRFSFAWLALVTAVLVKPQALFFAPLLLLLTIREKQWRTLYTLLPSIFFFGIVTVFYLGFDIVRVVSELFRTVERYPYLSVNAFNIWFPLTYAAQGFISDNTALFHFLSPRFIGIVLFSFFYGMIGRFIWRRPAVANGGDFSIIFFSAAFVAFAGFMVLTQMHERYLYPFFLLATPLLLSSRSWRIVWAMLSVSFLLNLFIAFPLPSGTSLVLLRVCIFFGMAINIIVFAWSISFLLSSLHDDQRLHRSANT
ncbi:MAG: hypothetical protein Q7S16_01575 [bacterium]|nr:hypothetical protein [bacterium]